MEDADLTVVEDLITLGAALLAMAVVPTVLAVAAVTVMHHAEELIATLAAGSN